MKTQLTLLASALLMLTATSCKKGDEDPALSLQTRKARLSGEWKLSAINISWTNYFDNILQNSGSTIGTESMVKTEFIQEGYTIKTTDNISENSLTINRDGTWSSVKNSNFETRVEDLEYITTNTGNVVKTESGIWSFVTKEKDTYKNKERMLLTTLSSEEAFGPSTYVQVKKGTEPLFTSTTESVGFTFLNTFAAGAKSKTYDLVMLKAKEMKWKLVADRTMDYNDLNYDYTSLETITWTAK